MTTKKAPKESSIRSFTRPATKMKRRHYEAELEKLRLIKDILNTEDEEAPKAKGKGKN